MSRKQEYKELSNIINHYHSNTFRFRRNVYVCLLVGENKRKRWERSCFSKLHVKGVMRDMPNIEICTEGIHPDYWEFKISILAHEFGHYLSWKNKECPPDKLEKRFHNGCNISKREAKIIIDEEKRAWKYGFAFLEEHGIEVEPEMFKIKKQCLQQYYRTAKMLAK